MWSAWPLFAKYPGFEFQVMRIRDTLAFSESEKLRFREECFYVGRNKVFITPRTFDNVLSKIEDGMLEDLKKTIYNIHVAAAKTYPAVYQALGRLHDEATHRVREMLGDEVLYTHTMHYCLRPCDGRLCKPLVMMPEMASGSRRVAAAVAPVTPAVAAVAVDLSDDDDLSVLPSPEPRRVYYPVESSTTGSFRCVPVANAIAPPPPPEDPEVNADVFDSPPPPEVNANDVIAIIAHNVNLNWASAQYAYTFATNTDAPGRGEVASHSSAFILWMQSLGHVNWKDMKLALLASGAKV